MSEGERFKKRKGRGKWKRNKKKREGERGKKRKGRESNLKRLMKGEKRENPSRN